MYKEFILLVLASCHCTTLYAEDLLTVYLLAQQNDASHQQAYATYHADAETWEQAKAEIYPKINASVGKSESSPNRTSDTLQASGDIRLKNENFNYSLILTQTLFDYRIFKGLSQAKDTIRKADADYRASQQDLILRTAKAYFDLLSAQDTLASTIAEKHSIKQQLEQIQQRYDVGLVPINDVKESQANYHSSIAQEISAQNTVYTATEALFTITNHDISTLKSLDVNMPLLPPDPSDKQHWVDRALAHNLKLLSASIDADMAKKKISVQRAEHYPTVGLSVKRSYQDTDGGLFGNNEKYDTTFSVDISIPIFAGGGIRSKVRETQYQYDAATQAMHLQRRQTIQNTRNTYQSVLASISRANAFKQALISTEAAYKATQAGFEVGTRTSADVLTALGKTYKAKRDYADAKYKYVIDQFKLQATIGHLSIDDLEAINRWLR